MKSVITAIFLLIPLVIVFVIIDRKDFYSDDDVVVHEQIITRMTSTAAGTLLKPVEQPEENKPITENKPTEAKHVEPKPVTETKLTKVKPTEMNPAAGAKPTEAKPTEINPVAEAKPAETKPAEVKLTETMSAETKPAEGKLAPAAIPVVSAEEAEKLNEFAIFLAGIKTTVVEGEIVERSELPDPLKSDYPNCRFTVHFNGNSIKSGEPCPKEMVLVVEGFSNYKVLATDKFATGDKIECSIIPFDALSEEHKSTQQADDLNLFLLDNYYVIDIKKISSFSDNAIMPKSGIFFSDGNEEYVSIFDRHLNDPISPEIKAMQDADMQHDNKKMSNLLSGYTDERIKEINARFTEVWNEEKKNDPTGYNRVGNFVWRNIDNSFWCLPVNYTLLTKPSMLTQKALDSFVALKEACESNGVQLIVSLIPDLFVVSSRVINKEFQDIPDLQTAIYVKQLSEIGIETIYSTDAVIQNYNRFPFAFFFPGNGHPSDTTQDVNSDILVERLKRYGIMPELDPRLFSVKQSPHVYGNADAYLFPKDCDIGDNEAEKPYTCREILYDEKRIPRTSDAPIITLGNSFMQTPMASPDTLPTLLSMKLLTPVDYLRVNASGPFTSIITQLLVSPERYLKHRKVLIMQYGTSALAAYGNSLMVNIREEDENRLLFDKRSVVLTYDDLKSIEIDNSIDDSLWSNLPQKNTYQIGETESIKVASFSIEKKIDSSKSVVCMIPAVCFKDQSASFSVNGVKKSIPTFYRTPFYSFISFELPPGTKSIDVSIEGKKGTAVAIRDIQVWQ